MSNPYAAILQPGCIGTLALRNRIIMGPMGDSFAEPGGFCGERTQAYYEARAQGGAGLLTMGVCAVAYPAGTSEPHQIGVSHDDFIPGLATLAARVHKHGAKISMQLHHGGKTAANDIAEGRDLWVPSIPPAHKATVLEAATHEEFAAFVGGLGKARPRVRVMDEADIAQMIEYFAAAAARAQAAGFDGVEIHAAHTYIIAGFLSPYYNQRDDAWGGPLENRARLLLDIIRAVKARTGAHFPVWVRLDGEELHTPGGITLNDAVATARLAVAAGADAIHMSAYATITSGTEFTEAPLPQRPEAYVAYAKAVRAAVDVPVIAAGRIEPEAAARGIAAGEYDFVAMARQMLADTEIPNKLIANRPQDIRPCIYCYVCVSEIFVNKSIKCAVNAMTGHEHEHLIEPAAEARHVLVVGGGPAGMEAARVAALRGHRVTLVERSNRLGGTLFFAGLAYPENGRLLDYLVAQMEHPRIDIRLATEATPALLDELHPDRIIVATGARRAAPSIPGAEQRHVWSGDELRRLMTGDSADEIARAKLSLAERALFKAGGAIGVVNSRDALQSLSRLWMPLGKRVVIVGGGLVGLELAEFLLARGREVTVLEESDRAGRELAIVRRWRVLDAVRKHGTLQLQAKVQAIGKHDVQWCDADGTAHTTAADSVVLAIGAEPNDTLARQLEGHGIPVQAIGDGAGLGYIEGAMHGGNQAGRAV
ncbi:FAD-dependent oxidoreductase [Rhodanobacter glycinis]|uniref:FAD-dependent oxidoreductase n=1 Tax=Rhodanobacter glycinis TaxID=582702 RepID=A0A5B9DZK5_9GAMM|nr:FAD-dependent oxidoreductase [Rhodanobacter glycinis]QEE23396.1 FAD-dependent oxidoreductase [Rhodanobacter glycinis]